LTSSTDSVIGRIGRAHGIRGEVSVHVLGDARHFEPGSGMCAGNRQLVVAHARPHKDTLLVGFEGVDTRNDAEDLRGLELVVPFDGRPALEAGEFWPDDLIGLAVHGDDGPLGEVVGVIGGEAQDRLIVRTPAGRTFEVPFVDELVPDVVPEEGFIRIRPIEGLI
jgi:16S rRNA processing protein RimM